MWGDDHLLHTDKLGVNIGFVVKDVETGASKVAIPESVNQILLKNNGAAGGIY